MTGLGQTGAPRAADRPTGPVIVVALVSAIASLLDGHPEEP
ncbi:hypothetical protein J2S43_001572 [Catenuloplanes nepalensis]|uniref:Uncharacterized protein n=1 Tax=Catenuloplanes nepalensis TaxID=587533 RepID=A0ABT9MNT1_9ACTN|nr:hypothetical protein [Catenuloplanes nepalensis]MDP9793060.1 hypothetical protein [Catenuloplanes nepalensis]